MLDFFLCFPALVLSFLVLEFLLISRLLAGSWLWSHTLKMEEVRVGQRNCLPEQQRIPVQEREGEKIDAAVMQAAVMR